MRRCRMRSMWRSMHGALAEWQWEKMRPRNCRNATRLGNIEMSSWPTLEWKRPCWSATGKALFVIELWQTKKCGRLFKSNDVSRAIRLWRGNEEYCRVVGTFADGRVVRLVASPFHSPAGNFVAANCRAGTIHPGCSRSGPRRPGFRSNVRRDLREGSDFRHRAAGRSIASSPRSGDADDASWRQLCFAHRSRGSYESRAGLYLCQHPFQ